MINGTCLRNAIISGANNISRHKKLVNDMNIFPVPDGDTGTNMSMTICAASEKLFSNNSEDVSRVADFIASSMLRGARGNSGVILSLLFRGFAKGLEGIQIADPRSLIDALGLGVNAAYKAVANPTEGTILTVARVAYEEGLAALQDNIEIEKAWEAVCNGANEALKTTPDLLPVLKKAGVVDAGGQGLCYIFEGMLSVIKDDVIIEEDTKNTDAYISGNIKKDEFFLSAAAKFDQDITFTYCTEFIVGKSKEKEFNSDEFSEYLQTLGDCVVVVDDDEIIKVHVHTENPGTVLQSALEFGDLLTVKIENMKEQHKSAGAKETQKEPDEAEPIEDFGFVCVCAGDGLGVLFKDLGANKIVSGGQTMNPSTEDILEAVMATPAKTVYVLPNNKNIILAAEQCVSMANDREVIVIPTKTVPEGISAMLAFDDEINPKEGAEFMLRAAKRVSTGQITFAARKSEYGGFKIDKGDILALNNGKLTIVDNDPIKAAYKLTRSMAKKDTLFITLIYGEGLSEEDAEECKRMIEARVSKDIDITVINGGQPVYYFLISVE